MSGGFSFPTVPALGLIPRASDGGTTLQITALTAIGGVGDYFAAAGGMTSDQSLAANLKGDSNTQAQRVTTPSTGLYTWTYPVAFASGVVPVVEATCEGPDPQSGTIVNAQVEGTPTNTSCKIRVSRSTTTIQVLGINVLSLATAIATVIHLTAKVPTA